jgi:hypothetical protein
MGAGISFGGVSTGTWATNFAYIGGLKENSIDGNTSGKLVFGTRVNGNDGTADMTKMTILSNGNVGIGTTSPATLLHLYKPAGLGQTNILKVEADGSSLDNLGYAALELDGGISNTDNSYGVIAFMNKGVKKGFIAAKTATNVSNDSSGFIYLQVADNTGAFPSNYILTIDGSNNGNVGIGTGAPTQKLYVVGNVYATGSITQGSSRELKENIKELGRKQALETFSQLKPVTYVYKADKMQAHVGFVAEDVPALLATKDRKGVSPMDVTALLTKVVQEQQKTIEAMSKEIAILKAKVQ